MVATSTGLEGWLNRAIARTSRNKKLVAFRREKARNGHAADKGEISAQVDTLDNQTFNDVLHGKDKKVSKGAFNKTGRMLRKTLAFLGKDVALGTLCALSIDLFRGRTFDNPFDKTKEVVALPSTLESAGQAFMNLFKSNKKTVVEPEPEPEDEDRDIDRDGHGDTNNPKPNTPLTDEQKEKIVSDRLDALAELTKANDAQTQEFESVRKINVKSLESKLTDATRAKEQAESTLESTPSQSNVDAYNSATEKADLTKKALDEVTDAQKKIETAKRTAKAAEEAIVKEILYLPKEVHETVKTQYKDCVTKEDDLNAAEAAVKEFEQVSQDIEKKQARYKTLLTTPNRTDKQQEEFNKLKTDIKTLENKQKGETLEEKQGTQEAAQEAYDTAKIVLINALKDHVVLPDETDITPEKAKEKKEAAKTVSDEATAKLAKITSEVKAEKAAIGQTETDAIKAAQTTFAAANEAAKNIADPADKKTAKKEAEEAKKAAETAAKAKAKEANEVQEAKLNEAQEAQDQADATFNKAMATVLSIETNQAKVEAQGAQADAKDAAEKAEEAMEALNKKPDAEKPNDGRKEPPVIEAGEELAALADGTASIAAVHEAWKNSDTMLKRSPLPRRSMTEEQIQKRTAVNLLLRYAEFKKLDGSKRSKAEGNIEAMIGAIDDIYAAGKIEPDLAQKLNEVVSLAIKKELNSGKRHPKQLMHKHKWNLKRRRNSAFSEATKALGALNAPTESPLGKAIKTFMELNLGNKKASTPPPSGS